MKPPKRRLAVERSSDNEKRKLRAMPADLERRELSARATYAGSGKHKVNPRAFGLEPAAPAADDTFCDGHAGFTPEDMTLAPELLRRGVLAGLLGHNEKGGDPTLLWTVDDRGWVFEARITIPTQAVYHGYPLLDGDAFARKVIARYSEYVYAHPALELEPSLQKALDRYR
jgi:hypothetical protein